MQPNSSGRAPVCSAKNRSAGRITYRQGHLKPLPKGASEDPNERNEGAKLTGRFVSCHRQISSETDIHGGSTHPYRCWPEVVRPVVCDPRRKKGCKSRPSGNHPVAATNGLEAGSRKPPGGSWRKQTFIAPIGNDWVWSMAAIPTIVSGRRMLSLQPQIAVVYLCGEVGSLSAVSLPDLHRHSAAAPHLEATHLLDQRR